MIKAFVPIFIGFFVSAAQPVSAQDTPNAQPAALNLEQKTALRCSAAFALVAGAQAGGNEDALAYPALAVRGREFFVRSAAQLMDDTGLSNEAVGALVQAEVNELLETGQLYQVMPSCLLILEASGL